jgi:Protein of unknown function (DUF4065)
VDFDRAKFKALVHYVIWKAGRSDRFGATKLNKVLWFADARAFVLTGKPITGATYIREKWGPVPKQIMPVRAELEQEGAIKITHSRSGGDHTKFTAIITPITTLLTDGDLATVDYWINHIDKDHTAKSISDESHDYAWEIAKRGEELPLFALLANRIRDPNDEELAWAKSRALEKHLP